MWALDGKKRILNQNYEEYKTSSIIRPLVVWLVVEAGGWCIGYISYSFFDIITNLNKYFS